MVTTKTKFKKLAFDFYLSYHFSGLIVTVKLMHLLMLYASLREN